MKKFNFIIVYLILNLFGLITQLYSQTNIIDQAQEGTDYGFWFDQSIERWQEVIPAYNLMSKLELYIQKNGNPGNIIITIKDASNNVLSQKTILQNNVFTGWNTINFSPSISQTPGNSYKIFVKSSMPSPNVDNRYFWSGSANSTYPGLTSVFPSWPNFDFAFRTYYPSSYSITMNEPATNINLCQSDFFYITWTASGPSGSTISLRRDLDNIWDNGNESWIAVTELNDGSYTWNTSNVPLGTYYIAGMIVDANGYAYDYAAGKITIGKADLIVQNPNGPATANPGQVISISATVKNQGTCFAPGSTLGYYLSNSQTGTTYSLGTDGVSSLDPGQSSNESESVTIPTNVTSGSYYIVFKADITNDVEESNENNNFNNVPITITQQPTATITTSVASLPNFGNVVINTYSSPQNYTVSGVNLTAPIKIDAPNGFQISLSSGSGYSNTLTLNQSGGTVPPTTIYARFAPTLVQSYSGNITHTSTGATTKNVSVSGTGITQPSGTPLNILGPTTVSNGQQFELQIQIENVINLQVISFDFLYPTEYVDYITYTIGGFLPSHQATVIPNEPLGKVSASVYSIGNSASGTGVIITLKFGLVNNPPNATQLNFSFQNVLANNSNGDPISITPGTKTITTISGLTVWPGDTDNNGIVNIIDINPIIINFNSTGPSRNTTGCNWSVQLAPPWSLPSKTYVDANGNGTIEITDINCVIVNFNKTHSAENIASNSVNNSTNFANPPLTTSCPEGQLGGQEFWVYVNIGSQNLPVTNMNVLSFELKYTGTQYIDYLSDELGSFLSGFNSTIIPDDLNGKISASAYNITQGVSGFGEAFKFKFKVQDTVQTYHPISFYWGLASANNIGGLEQPLDTLGCVGTIIPVELSFFKATQLGAKVNLQWSTASETNNIGFDVEKSSDQNNWIKLGFVSGKGTTTEKTNYSYLDDNILTGISYYRLKQIDFDGSINYSAIVNVIVAAPKEFILSQNYPNPFNPISKIDYSIPKESFVTVSIYNILGDNIATLVNEKKEAGNYSLDFNASNLPSGVYFYQLKASDPSTGSGQVFLETKKMLLLK